MVRLRSQPITFALVAVISSLLGTPAMPATPQHREILVQSTLRNGMRSCPPRSFVTGVHVSNSQLLCTTGYGKYSVEQEIIDGQKNGKDDPDARTIKDRMHSCPDGMAVTGIHVDRKLLACAPFDQSLVGFGKLGWMPRVDSGTRRKVGASETMSACPDKRPVLGIHVENTLLRCIGPGSE